MRFHEDDLLPLSGLQHLVFCERQAALIHTERVWADDSFTVDGSHRHRRVHEGAPRRERRGDVILVRGLLLHSLRLGLSGVADVVEFHRVAEPERGRTETRPDGVRLPGASGWWVPFPVEYKRGRPKVHRADEVQLCAQAICLEEMLDARIPGGALFYGKEQRRTAVVFEPALRDLTEASALRFRHLVVQGQTPRAAKEKKCGSCSLVSLCIPGSMSRRRSAVRYVAAEVNRSLAP